MTLKIATIILCAILTTTAANATKTEKSRNFNGIGLRLKKHRPPTDPVGYIKNLLEKNGCNYVFKHNTICYDPTLKDTPCQMELNELTVGPRFFAESKKCQLTYLLHEGGHAAHHDLVKHLCIVAISSYIGSKLLTAALSLCLPTQTPKLIYGTVQPLFWYGTFISTPYFVPHLFAPVFRRAEKRADLYAMTHAPTQKHREAYLAAFKHYASYEKGTFTEKIRQFFEDPGHPSNATRVAYMQKYMQNPPKPYRLPTLADSDIDKGLLLDS